MRRIALFILLFFAVSLNAQRGKNGNVTIATAKVVNEYTTLTVDAAAGSTSITVANSGLNTKARFAGNLAAGDLVMIIQMQGATINGAAESKFLGNANTATPNDSSWGRVTSYGNAGNYEFAEVASVPGGTTIQFDCALQHNYTATGHVQVVRVPRYNTLTINSPGIISCDTWDSAMGGIVAIEVLGNTVINTGGSISSSGNGFRGGILSVAMDSSFYGVNNTAEDAFLMPWGKLKGEGIAGYGWSYDQYGGRYGKGAAANGGGGADAHNGGGGGGANGGDTAGWINGYGIPDVSINNNKLAWALEYSWLPTFKGSGGGRGGYTFSSNLKDPTTTAPSNSAWGGDDRHPQGGWGGRPMDYTTGRIFMGGGGGAGDQDNNVGGSGGNGGGIVYLISYGTITGGGQITANGANGTNSVYNSPSKAGDGAGGAGGGGAILINSIGNVSGVTLQANGGTGGNQVIVALITEAEGPGGGGGGGYIATSNAIATETVTGGVNGTTNAKAMAKFLPNGATGGSSGTIGSAITNFQIVAKNDTICSGQTATLNASLTGTVPGGTSVNWYAASTGGIAIGSGPSYTTGALTKDTVIYIGTCPGIYRQAVNIIITGSSSITINPPATICSGSNTNLLATGGTAYAWQPAASLNNAGISNPVATPTTTTTYTVQITTPCGLQKDSVVITVTATPVVTATATPSTICFGNTTSLSASGGTAYSWSNGATTATTTASPATTATYTVHITTACGVVKDSAIVTVNPKPNVTVTPPSASICSGGSIGLTANNASTYTWSPSASLNQSTGTSVIANPSGNTTYTVIGTTAAGCADTANIAVTVGGSITASITGKDSICSGSTTTLTASGGTSYSWSNGATTSVINVNPSSTTPFKVVVSSGSCKDSSTVTVQVTPAFKPTITGNSSICAGTNTVLTATGGGSYLWNTGATTASITVSPSSTTPYSVTVTNGSCKPDTSIIVTVNNLPVPTISAPKTLCSGASDSLSAGGGSSYAWSPSAGLSCTNCPNPIATPTSTTSYSVQVSNGTCTAIDTVKITVNIVNAITACCDTTIQLGSSAALNACCATSYAWSPSATVANSNSAGTTVKPTVNTTYTVVGIDVNGCSSEYTVTVDIACNDFTVPNVFTPASSVSPPNNVFYIKGANEESNYEIEILDRWGIELFKSNDPNTSWDGKNKSGQLVPDGVYYYIIKASCGSNNYDKHGFVQVIK